MDENELDLTYEECVKIWDRFKLIKTLFQSVYDKYGAENARPLIDALNTMTEGDIYYNKSKDIKIQYIYSIIESLEFIWNARST